MRRFLDMGTPRDEEPLVGNGGSADETGWEDQPTRPDRRPRSPAPDDGKQGEPFSPEHETDPTDPIDEKQ